VLPFDQVVFRDGFSERAISRVLRYLGSTVLSSQRLFFIKAAFDTASELVDFLGGARFIGPEVNDLRAPTDRALIEHLHPQLPHLVITL